MKKRTRTKAARPRPAEIDVEEYADAMLDFQVECQAAGVSFMVAVMEGLRIKSAMLKRGLSLQQVMACVTHLRTKAT